VRTERGELGRAGIQVRIETGLGRAGFQVGTKRGLGFQVMEGKEGQGFR
jgi:hypothetical protein